MLSALTALPLFAQEEFAPNAAFTGGFSYSTLHSDNFKSNAFPGYSFGLAYSFLQHEDWEIESDFFYNRSLQFLDYNQGGKKKEQGYDFEDFTLGLNANYYLIPYEEAAVYMGVQGGGYFSLLLSKWSPLNDKDVSGQIYNNGVTGASFDGIRNSNYGVNFGLFAGYDGVKVVAKYSLGLSNALDGLQNNNFSNGNYNGPDFKGTIKTFSLTVYIGGKL